FGLIVFGSMKGRSYVSNFLCLLLQGEAGSGHTLSGVCAPIADVITGEIRMANMIPIKRFRCLMQCSPERRSNHSSVNGGDHLAHSALHSDQCGARYDVMADV